MDIEQYYDKIYRYCFFKVNNRSLAEDLTQETFLRFLNSDSRQPERYLYTIAKNLCIDEYRKNRYEMAFLTKEEIQYWDDKEASVKKPFVYHDTVVSAGLLEGTTNYGIMILMIIAISLSSIFAMETQRRTDPMIRATINGTKALYFAKVLAGMSYILCCLAILLTGFISYIGIAWGFEGIDSSIITYRPFTSLNLTIAELEKILVILLFLGACLVSSFALFVSNVSRNSLATMAVVIGTYLVMFILSTGIPYKFRAVSQFLCLLPSTLISSRLVYEFRLVKIGKYFLSYQVAPVLYIILTVVFIWSGYIFYRRHEIKNN